VFVYIHRHAYSLYPWTNCNAHSSKHADWLMEVPFKQVFLDIFPFWGLFSPKTPNISMPAGKSHAKRKCRITFNPFELGQKLPLTTKIRSHGHSFRIRHEKSPKAPPDWEITMTSYPVCNKTSLSRKPWISDKINVERYQEVMVALSESVMKICLMRPLAEKSRWRHIR